MLPAPKWQNLKESRKILRFTDPCGSDALGSSALEFRVYTKQLIRADNLIGGTRDTIESLLTEGAAGGQYNLF